VITDSTWYEVEWRIATHPANPWHRYCDDPLSYDNALVFKKDHEASGPYECRIVRVTMTREVIDEAAWKGF